jgi:mono/diheme cytochrome c family protein
MRDAKRFSCSPVKVLLATKWPEAAAYTWKKGDITYMPMPRWVGFALAGLAIAAWGHEGHGKAYAPAAAKKLRSPITANAESLAKGKALYMEQCAVCHGEDGKARTDMAKAMKAKPTDFTSAAMAGITEGEMFWVITHGIEKEGMPAFEKKMDDTARWQATQFVRSLKPPAARSKKKAAK